jgi:hypothetical protein
MPGRGVKHLESALAVKQLAGRAQSRDPRASKQSSQGLRSTTARTASPRRQRPGNQNLEARHHSRAISCGTWASVAPTAPISAASRSPARPASQSPLPTSRIAWAGADHLHQLRRTGCFRREQIKRVAVDRDPKLLASELGDSDEVLLMAASISSVPGAERGISLHLTHAALAASSSHCPRFAMCERVDRSARGLASACGRCHLRSSRARLAEPHDRPSCGTHRS